MGLTLPLSAHRRAELREPDERIMALIEAAYADERRTDLGHLATMAYDLFSTVKPPAPLIPNLQPELFLSYDRARALESIVQSALEGRLPHARAFGDALSRAFGPYLIEVPFAHEELILLGLYLDVPIPTVLAQDGVHAIDLLIDDPDRRLVACIDREAFDLLHALRDCVLRRVPILIDDDCARFPHPAMVRHRPIAEADLELLRALSPEADVF